MVAHPRLGETMLKLPPGLTLKSCGVATLMLNADEKSIGTTVVSTSAGPDTLKA
jgi:hypothetical protein